MNDNEVTERLIEDEGPSSPKSTNKKKFLIPVIVLVILLLIGGGVGGYYFYRQSELTKNLELGQKYLDEGDYENAVIAFEDAIKISDNNTEIYQGLAQAYIGQEDFNKAQQTYQKLFDMTSDPKYEYLAQVSVVGNSAGNISNNGYVAAHGRDTYIVQVADGNLSLWKRAGGQMTEVGNLPQSVRTGYAPAINLNIWGNNAFYKDGGGLVYKYDYVEKQEIVHSSQEDSFKSYQIYKDQLYGVPYSYKIPYVLRCSVEDGVEIQENYDLHNSGYSLGEIFVVDDKMFVTGLEENSSPATTRIYMYSITSDSTTPETIYESKEGILDYAVSNGKIYLRTFDPANTGSNYLQGEPVIKVYDIKEGKLSEIDLGEQPDAMNVYGNTLYYTSGTTLNSYDLENGEKQEIGTFNTSGTNLLTTIAIGSDEVIATVKEDTNASGGNLDYYVFPFDDPEAFTQLEFIETKSDVDSKAAETKTTGSDDYKAAYREQVKEIYNQQNELFPNANGENLADYYLFDIDSNGTPELLIRQAENMNEHEYKIFTYEDGKVQPVGSINSRYATLYGEDNAESGQLISFEMQSGDYSVIEVNLENGQISTNTIENGKGYDPPAGYVKVPSAYGNDLSLLE